MRIFEPSKPISFGPATRGRAPGYPLQIPSRALSRQVPPGRIGAAGLRYRESSSRAAAVWRKAPAIDPGTRSGSASTSPGCAGLARPASYSDESERPASRRIRLIQVFPLLGFGIAAIVHTYEPETGPAPYDLTNFSCHESTSGDARHTSGTRKTAIQLFWLNLEV